MYDAGRNVAAAVLAGIVFPGLGHLYAGYLRRGLLLGGAVLVLGFSTLTLLSRARLLDAIVMLGVTVLVAVAVIVDAGRVAVRGGGYHGLASRIIVVVVSALLFAAGASALMRDRLYEIIVTRDGGLPFSTGHGAADETARVLITPPPRAATSNPMTSSCCAMRSSSEAATTSLCAASWGSPATSSSNRTVTFASAPKRCRGTADRSMKRQRLV